MTHEAHYTIGELADLTGVTARTIRYYTAEGLLPPPDTRGRYALYGDEHVLRLRLIARLKDAYLPLSEIKARLECLNAAQLAQLLEERSQPPAPTGSAADYIAQVLASAGAPPAAASYPSSQPAAHEAHKPEARKLAESAAGYAPAQERDTALGTQLPIGYAAPAPVHGLFQRLAPQRREAATQDASAETWQRMILAAGVELHMREPLSPELHERIARLIEQARELFDE